MNPVHLPKNISGKMDRALLPVLIYVFAQRLYLVSYKRGLGRLMAASVNLHGCVSKRARQPV
jgi:hypothetical protein